MNGVLIESDLTKGDIVEAMMEEARRLGVPVSRMQKLASPAGLRLVTGAGEIKTVLVVGDPSHWRRDQCVRQVAEALAA